MTMCDVRTTRTPRRQDRPYIQGRDRFCNESGRPRKFSNESTTKTFARYGASAHNSTRRGSRILTRWRSLLS